MRRNARALIAIMLLVVGAGLALGFQTIDILGFERGGPTFLGLSLGLDLQGGSHLVYRAEPIAEDGGEPQPPDADDMDSLKRIIERRVNSSGLGEPIIQILGEDRLLIQLPGVGDPERAESIIGETARLEFKHRSVSPPRNLSTAGIITEEDIVSVTAEPIPEELLPESETATESEQASEASDEEPDESSEESEAEEEPIPVIIVEFTPQGATKFDEVLATLTQDFQVAAATANIFTFQSQLQAGILPGMNVTINGNELISGVVAPPAISKLDGTNRYVFPYPQPEPPPPAQPGETLPEIETHDLAAAQARVGDSATVTFIEQPGRVDEGLWPWR